MGLVLAVLLATADSARFDLDFQREEQMPLASAGKVVPTTLLMAHNFNMTYEEAYAAYWRAERSASALADEVQTWNSPEVFSRWQFESKWRSDCWYMLSAALRYDRDMTVSGYIETKDSYVAGDQKYEYTWYKPIWSLESAKAHVERRISYLDRLRGMIGDEAFFAGEMPDPMCYYKR